MALPATDNFNRADGPLGANWTNQFNSAQVLSNAYQPTGGGFGYDYWSADAFPDDQYVQATLAANGVSQYVGITARASDTGASFNNYFLYIDNANIILYKTVGGSGTALQTISGEGATVTVYKLTAVGSDLKAYKTGVQIGSTQVDSALTSGSAGAGGFSGATLDDWEGGSIGAAPKRFLATRF